ncbi:MAG: hypothetical protein WDN27_03085 [Candidatus Saccharibacteria bacterium]
MTEMLLKGVNPDAAGNGEVPYDVLVEAREAYTERLARLSTAEVVGFEDDDRVAGCAD